MPATYVEARVSDFRTRVRFPAPPPCSGAADAVPSHRLVIAPPVLPKAFVQAGSIPGASITIRLILPYLRALCPSNVSPGVAPTATERPPSSRERTSIAIPSSLADRERCMYLIVAAKADRCNSPQLSMCLAR